MTTPTIGVAVINGPNLNLLGTRQPEIYGTTTLSQLEANLAEWAGLRGMTVGFTQSNHEGEIIDALHAASGLDGIVLNPGAFAHTSRAIADAVASIDAPVVEVHISNVKAREPWRAISVLDEVVVRSIYGRGLTGYKDALRLLVNLEVPPTSLSYGPHPENVGDLRVPDGAKDVVMLLHGGFWLREWGRDTMDSIAVALHGLGLATWNIEYRRHGAGGAWPGSIEDVRLAHGFLSNHSPVSESHLTLLGHSAGGYLALALAEEIDLAGTIVLAPITDLGLVRDGGGPGGPMAEGLIASGAPQSVAGRNVYTIHGVLDDLVSPGHSERLSDATIEMIPDTGHFELLDPALPPWASVLRAIGLSR